MAKVLLSNLYTVAKGENETCGGIYGLVGSCATGLSCVDPPNIEAWEPGRCVKNVEAVLNPPSESYNFEEESTGVSFSRNKLIKKC